MKRQSLTQKEIQKLNNALQLTPEPVDYLPRVLDRHDRTYLLTSPAAKLTQELLAVLDKGDSTGEKGNKSNLLTWQKRSEEISNNIYKQISLFDLKNNETPSVGVMKVTEEFATFIQIENTSNLSRRNSASRKILNVILGEAMKHVHNGLLIGGVKIPYSIFIEGGMYSKRQYARENFIKQFETVLDHIIVYAINNKSKKTPEELKKDLLKRVESNRNLGNSYKRIRLFVRADYETDYAVVYFNPYMTYEALFQYYTPMPIEGLGLDKKSGGRGKAYDLFCSIFHHARQNHNKIRTGGGYTLRLKTVLRDLGLPEVEGNKDLRRTILDPIEKAIVEIEDTVKGICDKKGIKPYLQITPTGFNYEDTPKTIIETGKLEIAFFGEWLDYYKQLAKNQEREIAEMRALAERRKARIEKSIGKTIGRSIAEKIK